MQSNLKTFIKKYKLFHFFKFSFEETGIVNREIMGRLMSSVDYLNVMTYDYSSAQ